MWRLIEDLTGSGVASVLALLVAVSALLWRLSWLWRRR